MRPFINNHVQIYLKLSSLWFKAINMDQRVRINVSANIGVKICCISGKISDLSQNFGCVPIAILPLRIHFPYHVHLIYYIASGKYIRQ